MPLHDLALPDVDCLLVVPPLAQPFWPSLGVHLLQACGREAGFEVAVLYMSLRYAEAVGRDAYAALANAPSHWLLGDRLFARAAFGAPPLGFRTTEFLDTVAARAAAQPGEDSVDPAGLAAHEQAAFDLTEALAEAIAAKGYPVVGATTTFDQTSAALALLSRVKARSPGTRVILGGANCEGEMARGIRSLGAPLDHVFSGESEEVFVRFLQDVRAGRDPGPPILEGSPCLDMDALPTPRFDEFLAQVARLGDPADMPLWLTYETSRGCWWGQKHHCTFCGLNALGMSFREKSPDRVIGQLRELLAGAPTKRVHVTDNIMPWRYHDTLVPRLASEVGPVELFYEQKANLSLGRLQALHDAGVRAIQPGIEALDSDLLRLVRKGVLARQNLSLLRYARSLGMALHWNLLWGLPGDDAAAYERTLSLLPHIHHLCPPLALVHVSIDRFSPYYDEAEAFGVTDLEPVGAYGDIYPATADLPRLAYHFRATYESGSKDALDLMRALNEELGRWHRAWRGDPRQRPALHVTRAGPGRYVSIDTRGGGRPPTLYLNDAQARAALVGGPLDRVPAASWALRAGYAVRLDGWCAPLAVAPPALLAELEGDTRAGDVHPESVAIGAL